MCVCVLGGGGGEEHYSILASRSMCHATEQGIIFTFLSLKQGIKFHNYKYFEQWAPDRVLQFLESL